MEWIPDKEYTETYEKKMEIDNQIKSLQAQLEQLEKEKANL